MKFNRFEYELLKFIKEKRIILPGEKIVLAVSGGADSVAMMYALANLRSELKAEFFVAHLNHMIRPEAIKEGPAVCKMATELGMKCLMEKRDVLKFKRENPSLSLEEAARIVRYNFFEEVLKKFNADKVATAHHLSDLTENFFIRLFRGSGIGGLIGMRAVSGKYIKPFLFLDEESIREYVTIRRLKFFEDKTNEDVNYVRNKIRHKLIPFIKLEFCPDIEEKIRRTVQILEGYQDFVQFNIKKMFESAFYDQEGRIIFDLGKIAKERLLLEELAKEILRKNGLSISSVKIDALVNLITKRSSGQLNLGKKTFAVKYDSVLMIGEVPKIERWGKKKINVPSCVAVGPLALKISANVRNYDGYLGDGKKDAVLDADKVSFPIFIRMLKKDEKIIPLGMKKEKSVHSLLKDRKIPFFLRDKYPVVSQRDGKILWVVGVGISEQFKVSSKTKKVLVLRREGGSFF